MDVDKKFKKMLNENNLCYKCGQPCVVTSVIGISKTYSTPLKLIFDFNLCEHCNFLFNKVVENWYCNYNADYEAKKYIKKQIEVEVIQYTGKNVKEIVEFGKQENVIYNFYLNHIKIRTPKGVMKLYKGDLLVKFEKEKIYPLDKDIFEEIYSEVV